MFAEKVSIAQISTVRETLFKSDKLLYKNSQSSDTVVLNSIYEFVFSVVLKINSYVFL